MKFDYCIGNPPFQSDSKKLLYPDFYLSARKCSKFVDLIFPTGWQDPKNNNGLEKLNKEDVKQDKQIIYIKNVHNAFPGVKGAEWTNIILWQEGYNNGYNGLQKIFKDLHSNYEIKKLLTDKSEIVKPKEIIELSNLITSREDFSSIKNITTARKPYGLATDAFLNYEKYGLPKMQTEKLFPTDITIYKSIKEKVYVPENYPFPKLSSNFNKYKVLVPDAWGNLSKAGLGGAYADIIIAFPKEATLGTFIESGGFDDYNTAKKHAKYLMSRFYRAALYVNKHSIINSTAYGSVPVQNYTEDWWNSTIDEIDEHLFEKYNLPEHLRQYIRDNIQRKSERNIVNFNEEL